MFTSLRSRDGVLAGICMVVGAALMVVATVTWRTDTQGAVAGGLILVGTPVWLYGMIGLPIAAVRVRRPRFAAVATVVAVLGAAGGAAWAAQAVYEDALQVSHREATQVLAAHPLANLLFPASGAMFPAALALTGAGVWLSRVAPRWVAALFCVGGVLYPVSRITRSQWIAGSVDVLLLVACCVLVGVMLRRPARMLGSGDESGGGGSSYVQNPMS